MKTLKLTLKKKWFDMFANGTKNEEYREIKQYWASRFFNSDKSFKGFDLVEFTNGYGNNKPKITFELNCISNNYGKESMGAERNKMYYVIKVGKEVSRNF